MDIVEQHAVSALFDFSMSEARRVVDHIPLDRRVVLLGESTHGTEEFYRLRAEITKRLVEERGFTVCCFEADFPLMEACNDYTHGRRATHFPEQAHFPAWMWRNQCIVDLLDWSQARAVAQNNKAACVDLFGIDCYSLFESKDAVLQFLRKHDAAFAADVTARLKYLDKYDNGWQLADAMVHGALSRVAQHITDCLTSIQSRLQWGSDKYECTPRERLAAEQHCEVVIAATEYYCKCIGEPRGSRAGWNMRDQHMTTSLLRIMDRLNSPKVVVWAHNSHIGDATAQMRGGQGFEHNEQWNLGQMVRATFGASNVWIVGQYTHSGTVTAASDWGQPHANVPLRPALAESYEGQLHAVHAACAAGDRAWSFVTALAARDGAAAAHEHSATAAVAELLRGPPRLQRWVGVSYKPQTERESHYGELNFAACYDQIVYFDATSALRPIVPRAAPRAADSGGSASAPASRASTQRLMKELMRLQKTPPPGIEARPLESDLLEWYFVMRCTQPPFEGGEYLGRLSFPAAYPMAPPAFRVLTPSGRFEVDVRLCLSMSDYHPESWNPSWSVETLLVGLQSFMYEESNAIGSLSASVAERQRLAAASRSFNAKNAVYRELFAGGGSGGAGVGGADDEPVTAASQCRFCLTSDGDLISPCMCRGTNEWVHLACLREWQRQVVLTQPTHPKYTTNIDTVCNVCLEPFTGPGIPRSRHEQILEYLGGGEIAKLLVPGNLLVSARERSRENLELIEQHPEIRAQVSTWTKAVFLILKADVQQGERGFVCAVSCSQPLVAPPADARLPAVETRRWTSWAAAPTLAPDMPHVRVRLWDGGPVARRDEPFAIAHVPAFGGGARALPSGVRLVAPAWLWGAFADVADAIEALAATAAMNDVVTVNVVWGYAGWGGTQVLAEIGRGGWGLTPVADFLALRPDATLPIEWPLDFDWTRIVNIAKLPPPSEYMGRGKRR